MWNNNHAVDMVRHAMEVRQAYKQQHIDDDLTVIPVRLGPAEIPFKDLTALTDLLRGDIIAKAHNKDEITYQAALSLKSVIMSVMKKKGLPGDPRN